MKRVDRRRFNEILFSDVNVDNTKLNNAHNCNRNSRINGNARLSMGMYRTPEESERYINESLKRKLP